MWVSIGEVKQGAPKDKVVHVLKYLYAFTHTCDIESKGTIKFVKYGSDGTMSALSYDKTGKGLTLLKKFLSNTSSPLKPLFGLTLQYGFEADDADRDQKLDEVFYGLCEKLVFLSQQNLMPENLTATKLNVFGEAESHTKKTAPFRLEELEADADYEFDWTFTFATPIEDRDSFDVRGILRLNKSKQAEFLIKDILIPVS